MTRKSIEAALRLATRNGWHGRISRLQSLLHHIDEEDERIRQEHLAARHAPHTSAVSGGNNSENLIIYQINR